MIGCYYLLSSVYVADKVVRIILLFILCAAEITSSLVLFSSLVHSFVRYGYAPSMFAFVSSARHNRRDGEGRKTRAVTFKKFSLNNVRTRYNTLNNNCRKITWNNVSVLCICIYCMTSVCAHVLFGCIKNVSRCLFS